MADFLTFYAIMLAKRARGTSGSGSGSAIVASYSDTAGLATADRCFLYNATTGLYHEIQTEGSGDALHLIINPTGVATVPPKSFTP